MTLYQVYITPHALVEIKDLPGNIRQRVRLLIKDFAADPHPAQSKPLEYHDPDRQLYRLRLENWRIVYAITESDQIIDILAVRKRPPYDYGDLGKLLEELE